MTHEEIADLLAWAKSHLQARLACSPHFTGRLESSGACKDADCMRVQRDFAKAINALKSEPTPPKAAKAKRRKCAHNSVKWPAPQSNEAPQCQSCRVTVRCRVAHAQGRTYCTLNNLQCGYPECIEEQP